ncbi:MAG: sigma-70 family RNA polymerase sigma factor [Planctomycetes bacterium]|nr:sigma-70 family RNA polymerase sigma factor [Planctomycetota bacterium]
MHDDENWQRWLQAFRDGDPAAVRDFWDRYGRLLHQVANNQLGAKVRRRVGPEDIVQSACRTFFRRARGGEFELDDAEGLWRLLCAITLTKVREQVRFHTRKKRGLDQEVPIAPPAGESGAGFQPADKNPDPAELAEFADSFEKLLGSLEEEERQIVDLKLQECTHDEIAAQLGISERTVRRIFKRIQSKLGRVLEGENK